LFSVRIPDRGIKYGQGAVLFQLVTFPFGSMIPLIMAVSVEVVGDQSVWRLDGIDDQEILKVFPVSRSSKYADPGFVAIAATSAVVNNSTFAPASLIPLKFATGTHPD
jgi:hypothetical protein